MGELQTSLMPIMASLPSLIGAILILVIGFWLANSISDKVGKVIAKNPKIKEGTEKLFGTDEHSSLIVTVVVKLIFFVIILFVLGSVLDMLGLKSMTEPINQLLGPVFAFIPSLVAAILVAVVAFIVATIVKVIVEKAVKATKLDQKVAEETSNENANISKALADIAFWVVLFFFLPLILSSLQMTDILEPLQNMIDKILAFLPNLFTAAIILVVGLFIAKKLRDVVASVLSSFGVDNLLKTESQSEMKLSTILGMVVYVLILIPVVSASLSVLGLADLAKPITNMIDTILAYVPVVFSAAVIVFLAYIIGKIVGEIVTGVLEKFNLEKPLKEMGVLSEENTLNVAKIAGKALHVVIVFVAVLQATEVLGFTQLTLISQEILALASQVLLGLIVIAVGFYLANVVAKLIKAQKTASADTMALIARVVIIFLAVSMGLNQMGVADNIVNMAFGFTVGAIALAAAIAFGMGGREEAAKLLKEMREKK